MGVWNLWGLGEWRLGKGFWVVLKEEIGIEGWDRIGIDFTFGNLKEKEVRVLDLFWCYGI